MLRNTLLWYVTKGVRVLAITLRDVAQKAGVSAMTVSRVLNGRDGVDNETRRRVEDAVKALGYFPSRVAYSRASRKTSTIGLVLRDIANPFYSILAHAAEAAARRAGYRVLLCNTEGDLRIEREYLEDFVLYGVEGLLLAPASDESRHSVLPLLRRGFPVVLVDNTLPGVDCDVLVADNVAGAKRLVEHLGTLGHRHIAHIGDAEDTFTGRERFQGYRDGLTALGIEYHEGLVFRTVVDQLGGYRAAQQILTLNPRPTAIFAVNNMTAVGAMQALRERQLSVPQDIALVCFDDLESLAVLSPFLTVIDQPAAMLGKLGTQLLLERISGKAGSRHQRITLQTELIVRLSCGAGLGAPKKQEFNIG
ncbi:LacI family DNA-binding transcriptional regulator [Rhizobium sp. NPDC090279]|uniref:LacI family DNA-binding transcriptional regulator n=1 Tax=Rhizobium sp. NPDC090279 TaxID=3364499 RepID=UPI00383A7CE8